MSAQINKAPLGILAGEGALPIQLSHYCIKNNIPVCVVQFDACTYSDFPDIPIIRYRIEQVGKIFSFLRHNNVKNVVMVGNLNRPNIASLRPDLRGIKTLGKIAKSFLKGDDNLLRSLRMEIENSGFYVKGVDFYLTDLVSKAGVLTSKRIENDVNDAIMEALRYGANDKGQSILLHCDGSYSYETQDGTTALIEKEGREGTVLVKMVKPQQDPDLDRPTVGLNTLKALHGQQCMGMIIQANGVLMINKNDMIAYANEHDLFIEAVNVPK